MTYVGKKPADIIATAVDTTTGTFSGDLTVDTNTLYVDSANNRVGVGTVSPATALDVTGTATMDGLTVDGTASTSITSTNGNILNLYRSGTGSDSVAINFYDGSNDRSQIKSSDGGLSFHINGTTRAVDIDASGNLLVGTTDSSPENNSAGTSADNGIALTPYGYGSFSRYAANSGTGIPLFVNRTNADGILTEFRKDGSAVGSIGVQGARLTIGNDAVGLRFHGGNGDIYPWNMSTNALNDGGIDLGSSGARFKDLYLSGGVYLGGTGSANFLDDYEEGTFTLSVLTSGYTLIDTTGFYTKIGRQVTVVGHVKFDPVGGGNSLVTLSGLPFASANLDSDAYYSGVSREDTTAGDIFVVQQPRGTSNISINSMDGVGSGQNQIFVANRSYSFNVTYFV